uniref:Uncharacterized protein n=1 Tax=Rhizophora mucronata TaxID=61149 RepID=A0A2P2PVB0_RHIMU
MLEFWHPTIIQPITIGGKPQLS